MEKQPIRIAITGSGGQIAYSLLFRLLASSIFQASLTLHLQDLPGMESKLEGIAMELEDCAFPNLDGIKITSDLREAFDQVDIALLIGAKPRTKGMQRKDLLQENGKIFIDQGRALNERANRNVKVLVVGNPANTNCLIALSHAPDLPRKNFHALMRLDHNRAQALLARQAKVNLKEVKGLVIWGNHSNTQVPDFTHVKISENMDRKWLETHFIETVQNRGAQVIEKLGRSSAASAANATLDTLSSLFTQQEEWFSSAVSSDQNPYGIEEGLVFGFPCRSTGSGDYQIVKGLKIDDFVRKKIQITEKELVEERELCRQEGLL